MQPPVRIKLYGLFKLTKRTYYYCLAFEGAGLLALLIFWFVTLTPETPLEKIGQAPLNLWYLWRQYGPWVLGAGFLLAVAEACVVLKRFRQTEAQQQNATPQPKTQQGT